jgi:hypothetical protein
MHGAAAVEQGKGSRTAGVRTACWQLLRSAAGHAFDEHWLVLLGEVLLSVKVDVVP